MISQKQSRMTRQRSSVTVEMDSEGNGMCCHLGMVVYEIFFPSFLILSIVLSNIVQTGHMVMDRETRTHYASQGLVFN